MTDQPDARNSERLDLRPADLVQAIRDEQAEASRARNGARRSA